ncbi:MAG: hypothetical protein U9R56_05455, partial [candidate division Zixibacteria bacterium]|nr:hypothetical protein [candidate division Zixibacteria bacterium]
MKTKFAVTVSYLFFFLLGFCALSIQASRLPANHSASESGYLSNSVIDIIEHDGCVWLASGKGINVSIDQGTTWGIYNTASGMVSEDVSAMYSAGSRIWVGTNHGQLSDRVLYPYSDGVSYSDDNGLSWNQIDFSTFYRVWGIDRTIYDITGDGDRVFFAAFAGGFLTTADNGLSWRRIFPARTDSVQFYGGGAPSYRNRYFSCVTDTSHGDTIVVWAGTAGGLFEYVYVPPREKPFSKLINKIAFCDICDDTSFVYIGGDNGLTRGNTTGGPFISRFEDDLPGRFISALTDFRGRLLLGTVDPASHASTGLARSDDSGNTFYPVTSLVIDAADTIVDFASMGERLYMAAQSAGLLVSTDSGSNWEQILIEGPDENGYRNAVNALHPVGDSMFVGTDTGLAILSFDSDGSVLSSEFCEFEENDSSSARIIRINTQPFPDESGEELDSLIVWTVNMPLTPLGRSIIARRNAGSTNWSKLQVGVVSHDIGFLSDTVIVVSEMGIRFTDSVLFESYGLNPAFNFPVEQRDDNNDIVDSLANDNVTVLKIRGDTIFFGTANGFAVSNDRGKTFQIYRVNTDSVTADAVIPHNSYSTDYGLVGDFIPALGIQYVDGEAGRVWVSNRHVHYLDTNAISVGRLMPVNSYGEVVEPNDPDFEGYDRVWSALYRDGFAWNFDFSGDSVFAATDSGLLLNATGIGTTWDTIPLVDDFGDALVLSGTPVV